MATVAVSAVGATTMASTMRPATFDVLPVAAINESSSTVGIADSDLYFDSPAQIDAALDQMQSLGVNTVRVGIPWAGINPAQGYYNWSQSDYMINAADARGMGVLAVITTTPAYDQNPNSPGVYSAPTSAADFGAFAGLAAQRYAGKVGAYEIWNEPNAAAFYGPQPDPAGYTQLLKAAYPAIKAADPKATVVGGVVGSTVTYGNLTLNPVTFVDQMYQDGAKGYFDALSFHPYQYTTEFSQGGSLANSPINQLTDIRNLMVANGDSNKLVWASEYGEPTAVASEAQQAAYIQDLLTKWRTLGYTGPAFVYTLQDTDSSSSDPEATFGLIRSDGTWKPAAYVVQQLAQSSTAGAAPVMQVPVMQTPTLVTPVMQTPTLATPVMQTPVMQTPVVTTPVVTTPVVTTPVVTTPVVTTPVVTTPVMQVPVMQTPTLVAPVMQTPTLATPVMQTPVIKTAAVQTPAVQTPVVKTPTSQTTSIKAPVMQSPTIKTPTLQSPTLQSPTIKTPTLQSPTLKTADTSAPSK